MTREEMIRRGHEAFLKESLRSPQEVFEKLVRRGTINSKGEVILGPEEREKEHDQERAG